MITMKKSQKQIAATKAFFVYRGMKAKLDKAKLDKAKLDKALSENERLKARVGELEEELESRDTRHLPV